jgi:hypothetical protein
MSTSTQAAQLRLRQRTTDSSWVQPNFQLLQRMSADDTWTDNVDVTEDFDPLGVSLSIVGGVATFRAWFIRLVAAPGGTAPQIRLAFPDREDAVATVQYVGTICYQDGVTFDVYPAIITQFGVIEPIDRYQGIWMSLGVGDKMTFEASWFIEETP